MKGLSSVIGMSLDRLSESDVEGLLNAINRAVRIVEIAAEQDRQGDFSRTNGDRENDFGATPVGTARLYRNT